MTAWIEVAPNSSMSRRSTPSALPPLCGMPRSEVCQKPFVDRIDRDSGQFALCLISLEPLTLLGSVGELTKAIAELDASEERLEAIGHPVVLELRKRCHRRRPIGHDDRPFVSQTRLHLLGPDPKEALVVVGQ